MKKYIAEAFGSCLFFLFGVGSVLFLYNIDGGKLAASFSFGFIFIGLTFIIGEISGCHVNPIISLGLLLNRKIDLKTFLKYILSQFSGALIGTLVLLFIVSQCATFSPTDMLKACNGYAQLSPIKMSLTAVFFIEVNISAFLIVAFFSSDLSKKITAYGSIILSAVIILISLITININGVSLNPARSLGPAFLVSIFTGNFMPLSQLWLFIISPIFGGFFGLVILRMLSQGKESTKEQFKLSVKLFFKNYFKIKGRSSRGQFWRTLVFVLCVDLCETMFIFDFLSSQATMTLLFIGLFGLVSVFMFIPLITLTIRRLHDVGKPAYFYLIMFIPVLGPILVLIYCAKKGTGDNAYGKALNDNLSSNL